MAIDKRLYDKLIDASDEIIGSGLDSTSYNKIVVVSRNGDNKPTQVDLYQGATKVMEIISTYDVNGFVSNIDFNKI